MSSIYESKTMSGPYLVTTYANHEEVEEVGPFTSKTMSGPYIVSTYANDEEEEEEKEPMSEVYIFPGSLETFGFNTAMWYNMPKQGIVVKNLPAECKSVELFNVFSKIGWITHVEISQDKKKAFVYFDFWYSNEESIGLRDHIMECFPREYKIPGNKLLVSANTDKDMVYKPAMYSP
jgi:hypothetical protein